jgi:hypothetical protein
VKSTEATGIGFAPSCSQGAIPACGSVTPHCSGVTVMR